METVQILTTFFSLSLLAGKGKPGQTGRQRGGVQVLYPGTTWTVHGIVHNIDEPWCLLLYREASTHNMLVWGLKPFQRFFFNWLKRYHQLIRNTHFFNVSFIIGSYSCR